MSSLDEPVAGVTPRPAPRRKIRRLAFGAATVAVAVGIGAYFQFFYVVVRPPEVDTTGLDPAIGKAIAEARTKVLREPDSAQAWGRFGMVLITHDFRAAANFCLERAENLDAREVRWPYFRALGAIAFGEGESAVPLLVRAADLAGREYDSPPLRLAELYLSLDRLDDAEMYFNRLLKEHSPGHAKARLGMARILYARGEMDGALLHLRFAQDNSKTQKSATLLFAEIQQRLGHPAEAEAARRRAARMPDDPYWPDALNEEVIDLRRGKQHALQWAHILSKNGQGARAIEVLQKAVEDYPQADDAWLHLGNVLLKYKNPQLAAEALRRATELAPTSHEAHYYLGAALIVLGDKVGAADCFHKAVQIKADFAPAHHNLGKCFADSGDVDRAIESFRIAVRHDPTLYESHTNLARSLADKRYYFEALLEAQTAQRLRPDDPQAQRILRRAALGWIAHSLTRIPDFPPFFWR